MTCRVSRPFEKAGTVAEPRRPLISGNWKMNLNHYEAIQTVQKLYWSMKSEDYRAAEVSVHPPFIDIRSVQTIVEADQMPISLGAQNCHFEDSGAFTGEVSPSMLAKLNVKYVLAGHSERRQLFGETDEMVGQKVAAILRNGMSPILCVGELDEERKEGLTEEVVRRQVTAGLAKVKKDAITNVVVAYEPVWAIGKGTPATADDADMMCKGIRALLAQKYGHDLAGQVRIQYGASVKGSNAREMIEPPDVDGLLVGGASLDPEEFARIVASVHS